MEIEKTLPIRKRNRLKNYDYSSCGAYFITVCTKDRKNILSTIVGEDSILPPDGVKLSPYGKIAETAIKDISGHYPHIELLQYVIMPNQIHLVLFITSVSGRLISSPTEKRASIITAVGQMKRQVSKNIGVSIWQRSFHDHVIRNHDDYLEICKYICENPIRWRFDKLYNE